MMIFDQGTYETDKWRDDEIGVTFHGERTAGRYVFFQTGGADWMVRRMDPPEPGWEPMPEVVAPMLATRAAGLPADDGDWGYEMGWGGRRVLRVRVGRSRTADGRRRRRRDLVVSGDPGARRGAGAGRGRAGRRDRGVRRTATERRRCWIAARRRRTPARHAARPSAPRCSSSRYDLLWLEGHAHRGGGRAMPSGASCWRACRSPATTGRRRPTSPAAARSRSRRPGPGLPGVVAKRLTPPTCPVVTAASGAPFRWPWTALRVQLRFTRADG